MSDVLIQGRELDFLLWDWLGLGTIIQQRRYQDHDRTTINAVLDLSTKLAETRLLSHYKAADQQEPYLDEVGTVHVLPAVGEALRELAQVGLFGTGFREELGGMNMPILAVAAGMAQFMAANLATAAYLMLTIANARLIATFGTPQQITEFAKPQIEGRVFGTMCLSEPQAGSALSDIRTRAVPDGECALGPKFRLFGNKMWISGGDQNISDNIVHLVLAKIPEADGRLLAGTKGISLFIVPKLLPGKRDRNDISVAGLNHKMGYRGTSNCLLNFGEGRFQPDGSPGAVGYLIGQAGQGLTLMFQMMNEARINVGLGAAAVAYRAYRTAVRYAGDRTQGRTLDSPGSDGAPIAIINHPDIQRMLLTQKCYAEGALAIVLYCAALVDKEAEDPKAAKLLALLTPIAKTWAAEWGLVANDLAIQVHGGYGYTRDFDVEQLYRDNRLNPIHEGTTGIQALDLLGRKILRSDDGGLHVLGERIGETIRRAAAEPQLLSFAKALEESWALLGGTIDILRTTTRSRALANATPFLFGFGHTVIAWLWLDQALLCTAEAVEGEDDAFYAGKRRACRFFYAMELPKTGAWLAAVGALSDVAIAVPREEF
jgi:alkylation response protein AidB-like acyl-CoA dehydrogenase